MASKDQSTKNMKLSAFFSGFRGLNKSSYLFFKPHFNSQFFSKIKFLFGHKTHWGRGIVNIPNRPCKSYKHAGRTLHFICLPHVYVSLVCQYGCQFYLSQPHQHIIQWIAVYRNALCIFWKGHFCTVQLQSAVLFLNMSYYKNLNLLNKSDIRETLNL